MRHSFRSLVGSGIAAAALFMTWSAMGQEAALRDPPNGFASQDRGAMRLTGDQARQVKFISAAPLAQFYPREAIARRQTGKALLDLLIDASGVVVDVRVLDEDPLGMGFGDAAAASAKTYKYYNPFNRLVAISTPVKFSP